MLHVPKNANGYNPNTVDPELRSRGRIKMTAATAVLLANETVEYTTDIRKLFPPCLFRRI